MSEVNAMSDEEKLSEYSRGRADAEAQHKDDIQALVTFLEHLLEDTKRLEKEYAGKQEISNKIMRTYYGAKKAILLELIEKLKWEFPFAFEEDDKTQ